jgi:predicted permease
MCLGVKSDDRRISSANHLGQGRSRRTSSSGRTGLRRGLVVAEVALAVVLCFGAGLMVQTVWGLEHVDLGFRPEGVLTLRTSLPHSPESPYRSFIARSAFYRGVIGRVRSIPGVVSAGYTTYQPLTNRGGTSGFLIEGVPPPPPGQRNDANHRVVSQDYLQTIGVRLVAGRFFNSFDGADSMPVAVINDAMARQYWPDTNSLGRRFRFNGDRQPWITIVGVVDNVRQMGLDVAGRAEMYFPATQPAASFGYYTPRDLAVRVQGDPLRYADAVRQAIWSVDHNQPVSDVMSLEQLVENELASQKTQLWLLSAFAALALLLAAVGLYGLLSYTVVQQTRDIGVRMALGARQSQVLMAIMSQGLRLVLAGILAGVTCAWWLSRLLGRLLYAVKPTDPATFAAVSVTLLVIGSIACYLPSIKAARMDPMLALRHE